MTSSTPSLSVAFTCSGSIGDWQIQHADDLIGPPLAVDGLPLLALRFFLALARDVSRWRSNPVQMSYRLPSAQKAYAIIPAHSPMISPRSDVVGSLLRPPELLAAQKQLTEGSITAAEFKRIEDKAVDQAFALQEEAELEVVTDGEMRRQSFQSQMTAAVEGFGEHSLDAFLWGDWHADPQIGNWVLERPSNLGVVGKLRRRRHLSAEEFTYLRAHSPHR